MIDYDKDIVLKLQKAEGYLYFNDRTHPLSVGNSGKVYYHRHVASMKLGRWLVEGEAVHHVDGDRTNNAFTNLVVVSEQDHRLLHGRDKSRRSCLAVTCNHCGKLFTLAKSKVMRRQNVYCGSRCSALGQRKAKRPPVKKLLAEVERLGYCATGRKYGVSDSAIRKWIRHAK